MIYTKPELVRMTVGLAKTYGVDPALICAISEVCTHWNPTVTDVRQIVQPLGVEYKIMDEARKRATRWGLTQIQGQTARDAGYTGDLGDLINPPSNLELCCKVLKASMDAGHRMEQTLLMWFGRDYRGRIVPVLRKASQYAEFIERMPVA